MIKYFKRNIRWFGLLLFFILLIQIDFNKVLTVLKTIEPKWVLVAGTLNFVFIFIKSVRWFYLIRVQNIDISFLTAIKIYHAGTYFSVVTPARVGDLIKAEYLKKDVNVEYTVGIFLVLIDRLFDLIVLVILFFLLSFQIYIANLFFSILICLILVPLLLSIISINKCRKYIVNMLLQASFINQLYQKYNSQLFNFINLIKNTSYSQYFASILSSIAAYFCLFLGCFALTIGMGIDLSLMEVSYCIVTANLISLIPVSISGVGTRDLTMIILFNYFNLDKNIALMFSFMYFIISLFFSNILGCYWFHSMKKTAHGNK